MNKRLILLILALPLILMLSLFTTANSVSIAIQVPVTGLEIILEGGNPMVYVNLDDEDGGKYTIDYVVYPTNATNKEVDVYFEQVDGSPLAQFKYDHETCTLTPTSTGKAQVVVQTKDGGYKAGFTIQVDSRSLQPLQSIQCSLSSDELFVGQTATISTTFLPANVSNKALSYQVEDQTVASVNNQGVVTGLKPGTTTITITSQHDQTISAMVTITVVNQDVLDLVQERVETSRNSVFVMYSVDAENFDLDFALTLDGEDASHIATAEKHADQDAIVCTFVEETFFGELTLSITVTINGTSTTKQCTIVRVEPGLSANWLEAGNSFGVMVGTTQTLYFNVTPQDATIDVQASFDQTSNLINVTVGDGQITIEGLNQGSVVLTLTITDTQNNVVTLTKTIVVYPNF